MPLTKLSVARSTESRISGKPVPDGEESKDENDGSLTSSCVFDLEQEPQGQQIPLLGDRVVRVATAISESRFPHARDDKGYTAISCYECINAVSCVSGASPGSK